MPRLSLLLLLICVTGLLPAQSLSLFPPTQANALVADSLASQQLTLASRSVLSVSPQLRPRFVRENPRGYSYLCRLELEVEESLPVGLWIKGGSEPQPSSAWQPPAAEENYLYLRLRWHLFR